MTEENCGTCKKNTFVCIADRRGFVLKEDIEYLENYTREKGCPFDDWENDDD